MATGIISTRYGRSLWDSTRNVWPKPNNYLNLSRTKTTPILSIATLHFNPPSTKYLNLYLMLMWRCLWNWRLKMVLTVYIKWSNIANWRPLLNLGCCLFMIDCMIFKRSLWILGLRNMEGCYWEIRWEWGRPFSPLPSLVCIGINGLFWLFAHHLWGSIGSKKFWPGWTSLLKNHRCRSTAREVLPSGKMLKPSSFPTT